MNKLIPTYQKYLQDNNPVIKFTPGIHLTELPKDVSDILTFDFRTDRRIVIQEPDHAAKFVIKDQVNSFEISSEGYLDVFDKNLFSDYLLTYSKIK